MNEPMPEHGNTWEHEVPDPRSPRGRWLMMAAQHHGRSHGRRHFGPGFGPGFGPEFRRGFPGAFFARGPKVGRGDVRASILVLLAEGPMHGYQIIQELTERSRGEWRPSPGSVYPTLQQLEDEGMVRSEEAEGRRVYRLTDEGRAEVERRGSAAAPWEVAGDEALMDLRDVGFQVVTAVMQVTQAGTTAQIERAKEILTETRRNLYRLLAEGEPESASPSTPDDPVEDA